MRTPKAAREGLKRMAAKKGVSVESISNKPVINGLEMDCLNAFLAIVSTQAFSLDAVKLYNDTYQVMDLQSFMSIMVYVHSEYQFLLQDDLKAKTRKGAKHGR